MNERGNRECLFMYEASTRQPETRSIIFLERWGEGGGMRDLYILRNRHRGWTRFLIGHA